MELCDYIMELIPEKIDYDTIQVEFIGLLSRVSGRMASLDNG
jgi:hypothetical protein